ncbi:hypothetical protein SAMN02745243_00968 [Hespellia stercorisuis DSM 15480]|uniref:Uncharacterized protein n=1 Tax=Hespellia stercorisuis DSM 15480 TaxID=1121950 RepID=A0A1M6KNH5_9FIRM|nr:hypothetical protein SAMN02745243_00968 [Hespellia stercorisuis DSM 15480]
MPDTPVRAAYTDTGLFNPYMNLHNQIYTPYLHFMEKKGILILALRFLDEYSWKIFFINSIVDRKTLYWQFTLLGIPM